MKIIIISILFITNVNFAYLSKHNANTNCEQVKKDITNDLQKDCLKDSYENDLIARLNCVEKIKSKVISANKTPQCSRLTTDIHGWMIGLERNKWPNSITHNGSDSGNVNYAKKKLKQSHYQGWDDKNINCDQMGKKIRKMIDDCFNEYKWKFDHSCSYQGSEQKCYGTLYDRAGCLKMIEDDYVNRNKNKCDKSGTFNSRIQHLESIHGNNPHDRMDCGRLTGIEPAKV